MPILSVGESRPRKWKPLAWLIMLVEGTDHSHSFVTYKDSRLDLRYVAEARGSGCRVLSNKEFKQTNYIVRIYQYEVDQLSLDEVHKFIYEHLSKPYGRLHLIGLLLMRLKVPIYRVFKIGRRPSNPFKDGKYSQICVELSAGAIERGQNIDLPGNIEDYGIKELHNINEQYGIKLPKSKVDAINANS